MVRDLRDRDDLPAADRSFLSNIKKYGWNVTNVFASEGETGPEWSYSTGLYHSFQHAEIAVFGLKIENMHKIINNIGEAVKNGARFEAGNEYHDIFARSVVVFKVFPALTIRNISGGVSGSTSKMPSPCCNASGQTVMGAMRGIRDAPHTWLLCSHYCSRLPKPCRDMRNSRSLDSASRRFAQGTLRSG